VTEQATSGLYCGQCNSTKPQTEFVGKAKPIVKMCAECRSRREGGTYQKMPPRRHLPIASDEPPRIIWNPRSGNSKLGPIGAATVSAETCPPSCGYYGKGCYAERGHVEQHWRRATVDGLPWDAFLREVRSLDPGALWRYAVAGDLPGIGETLDRKRLRQLVSANKGRRGFGFSHKPLKSLSDQVAIKMANERGFTINLSADNLSHADARAQLGIGPVAVVLPDDAPLRLQTPAGRTVFVCPAQTRKGVTCQSCQVCSRPNRTSIVGFLAHGDMHATVSLIAKGLTA